MGCAMRLDVLFHLESECFTSRHVKSETASFSRRRDFAVPFSKLVSIDKDLEPRITRMPSAASILADRGVSISSSYPSRPFPFLAVTLLASNEFADCGCPRRINVFFERFLYHAFVPPRRADLTCFRPSKRGSLERVPQHLGVCPFAALNRRVLELIPQPLYEINERTSNPL